MSTPPVSPMKRDSSLRLKHQPSTAPLTAKSPPSPYTALELNSLQSLSDGKPASTATEPLIFSGTTAAMGSNGNGTTTKRDTLPVKGGPTAKSSIHQRPFLVIFFNQLSILLRKNAILQWRYWPATLSQALIAPFIFQLLLFLLQQADYARQSVSNPHPDSYPLNGIPLCQGRNAIDPCITILYTPNDPVTTGIMSTLSSMNAERNGVTLNMESFSVTGNTTTPTSQLGIVPVTDTNTLYDYILNNPNSTTWGVSFSYVPGTGANKNVQYQLWFNYSLTANTTDIFGLPVVSMVRALDEAIITTLNGGVPIPLTINMKDWPLVPPSTLSDAMVQYLGSALFFCSQMIIFINVLNQIVTEKEMKLRHAMETMGLLPSVYWLSHFLSTSVVVVANALVTCIFGLIFNFKAFTNTNFGVTFVTFILFGLGMVMFAFFLSTFISKANVAIMVGIFLFIIGLLLEVVVFSGSTVGYIWWAQNLLPPIVWILLSLLPFFNFGRMFLDISTLTTGKLDTFTQSFIPGPGFPWSSLYNSIPTNLLPVFGSDNQTPSVGLSVNALYALMIDCVLYGVLLWYCDNVIPDEFGANRPAYFFLLPSYWGFVDSKTVDDEAWLSQNSGLAYDTIANEDADVKAARAEVLDSKNDFAVRIVNLRKVYGGGFIHNLLKKIIPNTPRPASMKVAVNSFTLGLEQGKLLALLGQNGAGKSTTMTMLSGLTPTSQGDALLYGYSVSKNIIELRKMMGICPQHDVLFDDLTAKEHIELYAGLKGVPSSEIKSLLVERLEAVRLTTVQNVRAVTYSGGMKRRLSLVIATIGDPQIIFMDEPTTGMDPVNRRHVWSFIEEFKKNRVVILTTHSMEEADVLGDNIAIMARGNLLAYGNAIHLKSKFGVGYRISIITIESKTQKVKQAISALVHNATLEDDSAGALIYQFPASALSSIPAVVAMLEKNEDGAIKTWGISQSTLEEVFLKLIRSVAPTNMKR